jgi:hypothetical protein
LFDSKDQLTEPQEIEDPNLEVDNQFIEEDPSQDNDFYENLAEDFPEEGLKKLSDFLLDAIGEDIESRKEWIDALETMKKYTGFSLEDSDESPFKFACRTFNLTFSTAIYRGYALARSELLPQSGPAGFKINGDSNESLEEKGEKVKDWLNYFLTVVDTGYYPDFERLLFYLIFSGSAFKKIYYDNALGRPVARFIMPEDFIVDGDCSSILESTRLTHVLHLYKREIILNQKNNLYRDVDLPYLKPDSDDDDDELDDKVDEVKSGVDLDVYSKRSSFPIYEVHTYINLEDYKSDNKKNDELNIPLPYIITIDKISKKVLSIRRNWEENDPEQKRQNHFIQYNYLPSFSVYGVGLAQLIGSGGITLTKIQRQLVDSGSFRNLPGGFRAKGFNQQNSDLPVGPGQWVEIDSGGAPLQNAFMPLPYQDPSSVSREIWMDIKSDVKELASISEMGMLDSKEDIPVGTAMAFLETSNRIQSTVLRSMHASLSNELQLLTKIFSKTLSVETFNSGSKKQQVTAEDFFDELAIVPVSDPSVNSTPQRIMKARATLETAMQDPGAHNMREVFKMNYKAQGLDDQEIERILKPEQEEEEVIPLDPVTENENLILGKPVKAAIWQYHAGHILAHGLIADQYPDLKPVIMAHIREHQAYEYLIKAEEMLGAQLPPLEELQNPEIQNSIAMGIAEALERNGDSTSSEPEPVDPNAILMEEIASKERIANLNAETDIFKSQMDFEKEKMKIESNKEIAQLKADTELTKQENQYA